MPRFTCCYRAVSHQHLFARTAHTLDGQTDKQSERERGREGRERKIDRWREGGEEIVEREITQSCFEEKKVSMALENGQKIGFTGI